MRVTGRRQNEDVQGRPFTKSSPVPQRPRRQPLFPSPLSGEERGSEALEGHRQVTDGLGLGLGSV